MLPGGIGRVLSESTKGMKPILTISVLVNLLCAVVFVVLVRRDPEVPPNPPPARPEEAPEIETPVQAEPPVAEESPSFHWSQLESADYATYRDNLRDFGCPEWLVRQIVFRDLIARSRLRAVEVEKHFPRRHLAVGSRRAVENPSPTRKLIQQIEFSWHASPLPVGLMRWVDANNIPTAWRSAAEIERTRLDMAERAYANRMEVGRSMDALFGVFWLEEGWKVALDPDLGKTAMVGFLDDDQSMTVFSRAIGLGAFREVMTERTRGIYIESDRAALRNHVHAELSRLTAELGPVASTELEARVGALLVRASPLFGLGGLRYSGVNGADYRDLCLLLYELVDPIEAAFGPVEEARTPERPHELEVLDAYVALVEERLGNDIAATVRRAADIVFHATTSFARAHDLHPAARDYIYETQRVLKLELATLEQRSDLSPEEKEEMRKSLVAETSRELSKVLTPAQVETYLHGTPDQPPIIFHGREGR